MSGVGGVSGSGGPSGPHGPEGDKPVPAALKESSTRIDKVFGNKIGEVLQNSDMTNVTEMNHKVTEGPSGDSAQKLGG